MRLFGKTRGKTSEYENIIKASGYRQLTLLQRLVVPPILDKRDVCVESGIHPGKTLSIAVSIVRKGIKTEAGITVLVLTTVREQAQKLLRTFSTSLRSFQSGLKIITIGFSDLIKKEARQLLERPHVVIGTPSRVIDHIRRGNIDLSGVDLVFIDEAEEYELEFENDVCFVLSKVREAPQIVRFSFARETSYDNLQQLMKRPVVIQEKDFEREHGQLIYAYLVSENLEDLLARVVLAMDFECVLIVVDGGATGKKLMTMLQNFHLEGILLQKETNQARIERAIDCAEYEHLDFIILHPETLAHIDLEGVSHIVFFEESTDNIALPNRVNLSQLGQTSIQCITLVAAKNEKQFLSIQERQNVKVEKKEIPANDQIIGQTVQRLVARSNVIGSKEEFEQYKKAVAKAVPFGKRTRVISCLLMESMQKILKKEIEFVTLFCNIGHSRGVSAKDIITLFITKLSIDKSLIRDVRIFDNYSFIEIAKDYADSAITAFANADYKGKKIIVNYSRKKTEKREFGTRRNKRA